MKTLDQSVLELEKLQEKINQEESQRREIKLTFAYKNCDEELIALEKRKDDVKRLQAELLKEVPDSMSDFTSLKMSIIEMMKMEDRYNIGNVKAKYSTKKAVNNMALLNLLGGDIKYFCEFVKTPQKTIKDHAKTLAPDEKKQFESCIEIISQELTDLTISQPD
jgi:hypothetical protein